eukprot:5396775-Prymnesium_polylepis.1
MLPLAARVAAHAAEAAAARELQRRLLRRREPALRECAHLREGRRLRGRPAACALHEEAHELGRLLGARAAHALCPRRSQGTCGVSARGGGGRRARRDVAARRQRGGAHLAHVAPEQQREREQARLSEAEPLPHVGQRHVLYLEGAHVATGQLDALDEHRRAVQQRIRVARDDGIGKAVAAERRCSRLALADARALADDRWAADHFEDCRHLAREAEEGRIRPAASACTAVPRCESLPQRARLGVRRRAVAAADDLSSEAQEPHDALKDELTCHSVRVELRRAGDDEVELVDQIDGVVKREPLAVEERERLGAGDRDEAAVVAQHVPEAADRHRAVGYRAVG